MNEPNLCAGNSHTHTRSTVLKEILKTRFNQLQGDFDIQYLSDVLFKVYVK